MEDPKQDAETPKDGERISEEEVGREDGLNDAEEAGPAGELPADH